MLHHRQTAASPYEREVETIFRLYQQRNFVKTESLTQSFLTRHPKHGAAWKVRGAVLQVLGRTEESITAKRNAVDLLPNDAEAHFNLAYGLQLQGRLIDAVEQYIKALQIKPDHADAYNNLGNALKMLGRLEEAEIFCRQAIAIQPDMANAHNNLGNVLQERGQWSQAQLSYREALKYKPDWAEAYNNLAISLQYQGLLDEAHACFRKVLQNRPDWSAAHSNLLYCLSHDVMLDPQALYAEHLAFAEQVETPLRASWPAHGNDKDPNRQLQVGIVSGDLYNHAIASFLEPVIKHLHASSELSLHAYYTHIAKDAVTERLHTCFSHWHDVPKLGDAELADKIRADGIDILIDLSGHTGHNRLPTFARKPAPVQATWMGFPGTTGLQAMDYYIGTPAAVPPGLEWQLTEKPVFLPASAPFRPDPLAPAVNALPALSNGYITFASFNRPSKLSASVIALWSMLLNRLPSARLLLAATPKDHHTAMIESFAQYGVESDRLFFAPRTTMEAYLAQHHHADICLDTFPYAGGTTSLHALWMGLPTLTLAGETVPSRTGAIVMDQVGLDQFIATSIEDFVEKGVYWAEHIDELAALRASMRERFAASPSGQPELIAAHLQTALRTMWQRWCNGLPPAPIDTTQLPVADAHFDATSSRSH